MHHRQALLAVLVLLASALAARAAPGANPQPALLTAAPVLALAMADDGTVLATTDDPGSAAPTPSNPGSSVNTWYVWRPDGTALSLGSADMANCGGARLQDLCQSPVPAAAIAADASRFAFASNVPSSVTDTTKAQLVVAAGSTVLARQFLPNPVTAAAMNHTGSSVAVLERVAHVGAADSAQVEWFDVAGANSVTNVMPAQGSAGPPMSLAMSDDGSRLAVVSDKVYLFVHGPALPTALGTGTPKAVALAGGGKHGMLWGTAAGDVAYAVDGDSGPRFTGTMGTSAVNAVAESRDGKWGAVGTQEGKVRLYALHETGIPAAAAGNEATLPDAVQQVQLSPDGQFLLVRSLSQVRLYLNAGNLTQLWNDTPATAPVGIGLSASGGLAATGVGSGVVRYPAVHAIRGDTIHDTMAPGTARTFTVNYRNDGNRAENATLDVWFPSGWFAQADRQAIAVPVDATTVVNLKVILPAFQPPGTFAVFLNHTVASTGVQGTTAVWITVPDTQVLLLDPVGPSSLAIRAGQTVQFVAQVENRGNLAATGHLSIKTEPDGWQAHLSDISVPLEPGAHSNVTVDLTAPPGVREGDSGHVTLVLAERSQEPLDLYGTVGARFKVNVAAAAFATVPAGNATEFAVTVGNLGNVIDSFDFVPTGVPEGWTVEFTPGNATVRELKAGGTATVRMLVRAPADATPGLKKQVTFEARSEGDPSATAEKTIQFTVTAEGTTVPPEEPGAPVNWALIGVVALFVLAVGGFVAGWVLLRR